MENLDFDPEASITVATGRPLIQDLEDSITVATGRPLIQDPEDSITVATGPSLIQDPEDSIRVAVGPSLIQDTRTPPRNTRQDCVACMDIGRICDRELPSCSQCVTSNARCRPRLQPVLRMSALTRRSVTPDVRSTSAIPSAHEPNNHEPSPQESTLPHASHQPSLGTNRLEPITIPSSPPPDQDPEFQPSHGTDPLVPIIIPSSPPPDQDLGSEFRLPPGHQQVLATMPLLFPIPYQIFWTEYLYPEYSENDHIRGMLRAIGEMYRAIPMSMSRDERVRAEGCDLKTTAVNTYRHTLEALGRSANEGKEDMGLFVITICLNSYFESLSGNIPAFIGRMHSVHHYFKMYNTLILHRSNEYRKDTRGMYPVQDCLRSLDRICYVALPLDRIHVDSKLILSEYNSHHRGQNSGESRDFISLRSLVSIIFEDEKIRRLVWSPTAIYTQETPLDSIYSVEEKLEQWKRLYLDLIPELDTDAALAILLDYPDHQAPRLVMPPSRYRSTTPHTSLAALHFNFYVARLKLALVLLGVDPTRNKMQTNFYLYETLKHAASHVTRGPWDALQVGVLPILHIVGLCSPRPSWVEWIKKACRSKSTEGIFNGHAFATNLESLHLMEGNRKSASLLRADEYPDPTKRVICEFVPELDGHHFISFFAAPIPDLEAQQERRGGYRTIGHTRWRYLHDEDGSYTPTWPLWRMYKEPFSEEWIYSTEAAQSWLQHARQKMFSLTRAMEEHMRGSEIL
ncbi:unnamed protein product [Periconia digitata]|uniref:Zn(2)-C6 fungal-type domain-containing protein n=1 Tax=Periconia digitata TaxID=1303443 RepID=A0A9W4XLJ1_9PLEO|nr:unnamed protein product [Periconia digitata]